MSVLTGSEQLDLSPVAWREGRLLNWPPPIRKRNGDLIMKAPCGSRLRHGLRGEQREATAPALLWLLPPASTFEIEMQVDLPHLADEAGLLVWRHCDEWAKFGLEHSSQGLVLGWAVAGRHGCDDRSPATSWRDGMATLRASRDLDSVHLHARRDGFDWRLVKSVPTLGAEAVHIGPYCASALRAGFSVRFMRAARAVT